MFFNLILIPKWVCNVIFSSSLVLDSDSLPCRSPSNIRLYVQNLSVIDNQCRLTELSKDFGALGPRQAHKELINAHRAPNATHRISD